MKLRKLMLAGGALAALVGVPAQAAIVDNPQFRVLGVVIVWGADGFGGGAATPVVSDFVIDTNGGGSLTGGDADLIAQDVHTVVTGSLTPTVDAVATDGTAFDVLNSSIGPSASTDSNSDGVLDANDTFSGFFIDENTTDIALANELESSFFVASNTPFAITGNAALVGTPTTFTLADIAWDMTVTPTGSVTNGAGSFAFGANAQDPVDTLASPPTDLSGLTGGNVYEASQRTAATPGSIAQQSVRFDVTYTLGGATGYDLSQGTGQIEADVTYTVFVP
ncbi:MAG: hypothetical protein AAFU66_05675 [Pseudomonadota bacterium]